MSKKTDQYILEAVDNIRSDREITKELLNDAIKWLSKDEARHKEVGIVMAKYVETLQRSNEQLVKLTALLHKKASNASDELTLLEKEKIFDLLKDSSEEGESV